MPITKINNIDIPTGTVFEGKGTVLKVYKHKILVGVKPNITGQSIYAASITPGQRSIIKVGDKVDYTFSMEL
jgi:hypothetical protein